MSAMDARIDHIVFWVDDPQRSVAFYEQVLSAPGERVAEFIAGYAPFPSVRISAETIIDLMPRAMASAVDAMTDADSSAGHRVNHLCLAMSAAEYAALSERLEERGIARSGRTRQSFGARGPAAESFYFADLDGNVLEARYYA